ncbi:tetratricopeptide repeat protein [Fusobacterium animalis]|uniref:tetratricopeptide repeat protein n=1 Tax=Fusobacterium animalis TaxID=76859 RepID=UPI0032484D8C
MDEKEREELLKEIEDYTKKIEEDPNNASYYNNRGIVYSNLEDYEKAIQDYNKAIELEPNDASYYNNRGTIFTNLEKYEEAIQDYNKAIELEPNDASTYFNRSIAFANLNNYDKAIENLNKTIELNPNDDSAYFNRGTAFTNLSNYEKAIKDLNKAIELNSNNASYYNYRGSLYINQGNYDKAIEDFNRAIELNPIFAFAYSNLGNLYNNLNNYDKAIENLNKAIELDHNFSDAYNIRGITYVNQEKFDEAINDFNRAIKLNPNDKEYYYNLGILYSDLNNYDKAIENLNKAIELDHNFSDACNVIEIISTTQNNKKVIKFGKNGSKQNIKESKEPIYSIMFNQINSLYITGNFKKIKDELLPKIEDFKKESEKQKNNSEIDKLTKKVELIESIFKDDPQKLEGYFIFADILGWKGIWKKKDKKNIASVTFLIKSILEKEFDRELKEKKYNISLISDTFIVFSKELELSNKISKKLMELCLENGLAIRGAISYGECYNRDTVYVGQAVDEAASWHDEGEEIGIFCTPSAKQEIINNKKIKKSDLLKDFIKLKSGEIETFFIDWYSDKTKKKFYELFDTIDKTSIKVYLKYLNTEEKFEKYGKE